jgi:uncharacterized damage-inducible protein DinB
VLVRGQRAPIAGRIAMDMCMADVTGIAGVAPGDEAVIIGAQGEERISADDLAELAGTISWEILAGITARVPRLYVRGGELESYTTLNHRIPAPLRSLGAPALCERHSVALLTPNVFTYPRNEPGTTGHLDLVEPLRTLPKNIADAVRDINDAQARVQPGDGEWSLKEIVGHLRDCSELDHKRLYMMSTQTDPVLEPYDPDELAKEHSYVDRDLQEMLHELAAHRERTVYLLTTLVNWNWARTGQHLEEGRMSIRQFVEYMIDHEAAHLADLQRLATALRQL